MMLVTKVLKKTTGEDNKKTEMYGPILPPILILSPIPILTSNRFMTANRAVGTGLTASAVISVSIS
jgi:hypothetical protein